MIFFSLIDLFQYERSKENWVPNLTKITNLLRRGRIAELPMKVGVSD